MSPAGQQLIVDGYNVIHAWPELEPIIRTGRVEDARRALLGALAEYSAASAERVVVVFDAHARSRDRHEGELVDGVTVIFGSRGNSADHVIERRVFVAAQRGEAGEITVATGDRLQRDMVMAMGAAVISPLALHREVLAVRATTADHSARRRRDARSGSRLDSGLDEATRAHLEQMRRGGGAAPTDAPSG